MILPLALTLITVCLQACNEVKADDDSISAVAVNNIDNGYVGTYDDIPVADDDLFSLEQSLSAKWTFFLYEMDQYNWARSSANNGDMEKKLKYVFANQFQWSVIYADGRKFGPTQGEYSPRTWLEKNDSETTLGIIRHSSGFVVPSYDHVLYVNELNKKVTLIGYHEHTFIGAEARFAIGDARHIALEKIVFNNDAGVWRMTDYKEVIYRASEIPGPRTPIILR